ncbi:MAG TPA: putative lipid II flippase FtsW [Candidatus Acidoferrum sp.]|nr:putative lipid II flippase FtsW [Candidatus Acidoferrum sp.]
MKCATTILAFCVAALLALGTVMLCSSPSGAKLLNQQLMWSVLGIAACVTAAAVDYRKLKSISIPLLLVTAILLAAVFVPHVGVKAGGARRWLNLHFMNFQPSEMAKLALIIVIAHYVDHFQRQMPTLKRGLFLPAAFIGPVLGLIFLEPDYGTTILLATVSAMMLVVGGVRMTVIGPTVLVGIVALSAAVMTNDIRRARVMAFIYPEQHQQTKGFQQYQATIALGSGGLTGVGLGDGRQKHGYVPANHTDFILSIVGEELGLVATMGVVIAFMAIAICGVFIASRAPDRFGMLLACGITFLIALQAFINIGVVTSALPNKGLALPFVSYGGSSIVAMLACVGVLFSVARRAKEPERARVRGRKGNPFNPGEIPSTQLP